MVEFSLKKALKPFTVDRGGLLKKCTPIDFGMAKKLLDHGYKQISKFNRWCPVEVSYCWQIRTCMLHVSTCMLHVSTCMLMCQHVKHIQYTLFSLAVQGSWFCTATTTKG